jgi:hypothetical protein
MVASHRISANGYLWAMCHDKLSWLSVTGCAEISLPKYGFKSRILNLGNVQPASQARSHPRRKRQDLGRLSRNSRHKSTLCHEDSGPGIRPTRIPVSRVKCCNSNWRVSVNVLLDHSPRRVNVTVHEPMASHNPVAAKTATQCK